MCRGGTLTGSSVGVEVTGRTNDVIIKGLSRDSSDQVVIHLNSTEWNGIRALTTQPSEYSECVQYTLNLLIPALKIKRDFDRDVNARLAYIDSAEFCERLGHVISQAPRYFNEWRHSQRIGPYLMANPEVLNMTQSGRSKTARIITINSHDEERLVFIEQIVSTANFSVDADTGLIVDRIAKSLDECFKSKLIGDKVGYPRTWHHVLPSGILWWRFEHQESFWGETKNIEVQLDATSYRVGDHSIDIRVYSPGVKP
ncbi:hypothetical protein S58_25840 [Bradyrhizobium oligotrophicum S58]|uniref:Uncharacterized protein n=2 Tax=Bradyrhizobium oligotrophicum TaxID=44255 RepID=M4ZQX4_9BRAD|nr:hypothetical protein S58_25840 [Bradyrhizobium oligotrophicum S58]